jgi:hypothetical protein
MPDMPASAKMTRNGLFFDNDRIRPALLGGQPHNVFVFLRYHVELNHGQELILVVREYFRTKFIAITIAHALFGNGCLHAGLLFWSNGPAKMNRFRDKNAK